LATRVCLDLIHAVVVVADAVAAKSRHHAVDVVWDLVDAAARKRAASSVKT